jgi:hypothetical protein
MFEDIKGVIRSRTSQKYRQYNGQRKNDKKTTIDKALYLEKSEQHEPHNKIDWFDFWRLTPLSAIFQLYHGD